MLVENLADEKVALKEKIRVATMAGKKVPVMDFVWAALMADVLVLEMVSMMVVLSVESKVHM